MSYSVNIYQEICQYLKNGQVELTELENMISHTYQILEHRVQASKGDLLALYLNAYLQKLTLLKGDLHETFA